MTSIRQIILEILTEFDRHPGNLERLIDSQLGHHTIEHRDRRFVFEIVYGVIRRRLSLDYAIDHFLTDPKTRKNIPLRRILRFGAYQILYMDRVPDHAAVNESVNLVKADPKQRHFSGVVNAILRNIISNRHKVPLPDPRKDLTARLSVEFSHASWMVERWLKNLGLGKTRQLLTYNNAKPAIYLRRKIRDMSRQQFESDVRTISDPANGYMNLYYKLKRTLDPESLRLIQQGLCVVQAPSSGWVTAMLDIRRGDHILDMCAAPGGKTALMAEVAGDEGTVCACELKSGRLLEMVDTITRLQLHNVYVLQSDGTKPPFSGTFDKVLLDAPCTGTGVLQRHPEARWMREAADIDRLTRLQAKLLDSAASQLGKGGILVYSTCSLEPEENQVQVESFLERNKSFALDKCPDLIPDRFVDNNGYLHITPFEHELDGMFGARLERIT